MEVLWIKDGNIGHEKQVRVLLDELSKTLTLNIDSREIKGIFPIFTYLEDVQEKYYDLIIGAGHRTYSSLLDTKKYQKERCITLAVLSPTFKRKEFDIICAPLHDKNKLKHLNNVVYFEGSLAKVCDDEPDQNIIMVGLGGKNKHYHFNEDHIIAQISYFISLQPNKKCYVFNSRRTPNSMNKRLERLFYDNESVVFIDFNNKSVSFESILHIASSKLITRDSVNMVYESLSSRGNTYLIDMKNYKTNKVVEAINNLIANKQIGYIDCSNIIDGISKMQLRKQNMHNQVYAEVEKVAFKITKLI